MEEEGTKEEPDFVTIILTYLTSVSYLFGHPSFYESDQIDANLAELPGPSTDASATATTASVAPADGTPANATSADAAPDSAAPEVATSAVATPSIPSAAAIMETSARINRWAATHQVWSESDEAAFQASNRELERIASLPTSDVQPQQLTAQELHDQLLPLFNLAVSEECREYLLSIRRGVISSRRMDDFDLTARNIETVSCGPLLADIQLTENLFNVLLKWLEADAKALKDPMPRTHQFNYMTAVWVPEAIGFALQKLNPNKSPEEIYAMVDEPPAQYREEDLREVHEEMLNPSYISATSAEEEQEAEDYDDCVFGEGEDEDDYEEEEDNVDQEKETDVVQVVDEEVVLIEEQHQSLPICSEEQAEEADAPAPVTNLSLPSVQQPLKEINVNNSERTKKSKSKQSCQPEKEIVPNWDTDDESDENRDVTQEKSSRKLDRRSIGLQQECNKRSKTTPSTPPMTKQNKMEGLFLSLASMIFNRQENPTPEEVEEAKAYLSDYDERSLAITESYMRRRSLKAPGVKQDPIKAVKSIQEIESSDDTFFKAFECFIFQNVDTSEQNIAEIDRYHAEKFHSASYESSEEPIKDKEQQLRKTEKRLETNQQQMIVSEKRRKATDTEAEAEVRRRRQQKLNASSRSIEKCALNKKHHQFEALKEEPSSSIPVKNHEPLLNEVDKEIEGRLWCLKVQDLDDQLATLRKFNMKLRSSDQRVELKIRKPIALLAE